MKNKTKKNVKVITMELSTVENLSGLYGSIVSLFRGRQLESLSKDKVDYFFSNLISQMSVPPISPRWASSCRGLALR